ncbi:MAG: hypothetical protein JWL68_4878 [Actinomycetia bacterium]|nr:hypothetical protein [Actinomycetes bacterium]
MTTTESTSRNDDRKLERTIRDALILAVGKRAADRALRHARNKAHDAGQRRLGHFAGHLAGYSALLAYIWHLRRAPKHSAG